MVINKLISGTCFRNSNCARYWSASAVVMLTSSAWACSGPGAGSEIMRATLIGWACALFTFSSVIVLFVNAKQHGGAIPWIAFILGLVFALAHPGVWMSATSGDCGSGRLMLSLIVTPVHAAILIPLGLSGAKKEDPFN